MKHNLAIYRKGYHAVMCGNAPIGISCMVSGGISRYYVGAAVLQIKNYDGYNIIYYYHILIPAYHISTTVSSGIKLRDA